MPDSAPSSSDAASDALFREMRDRVRGIFEHALTECNIPRTFGRNLQHERRHLKVGEELYDLAAFSRALVVSIGKAGHTMAEALAEIVGTGLSGVIAAPVAPPAQLFGFRYFTGGHPLPNEDSLRAGDAIQRLVTALTPETLVVFLISGGASTSCCRNFPPACARCSKAGSCARHRSPPIRRSRARISLRCCRMRRR